MITKEFYRVLKSCNKEHLDKWLTAYALANYEKGLRNGTDAVLTILKKEFQLKNRQTDRLKIQRDRMLQADTGQCVPAVEVTEGLPEKGVRVYDQFKC